ncbi:MAG: hypothetical protein NT001_02755, partial [Candidatus Woesearchaeota archaeon]|nr:hypothetical protein [Candidatus Woesearchaeota archaeon]
MARDRGLRSDPVLEALERWEEPSKEDLTNELGKECLDAFYYVFKMMGYKKRKDCDNLEVAHSYDVASRVNYFMSVRDAPHYHLVSAKMLGILHDIIEEKESGIDDVVTCFHELTQRFGKSSAEDVLLLTNPYPILVNELFGTDLRRIETSRRINLDEVMHEVKTRFDEVAERLEKYNSKNIRYNLGRHFITPYDLDIAFSLPSRVLQHNPEGFIHRDKLKEINLSLYEVYIKRIISACEQRRESGDSSFYIPILVKAADSVDALRTLPVSKAYEANSITRKAEIKIDQMQEYVLQLNGRDPINGIISESVHDLKSHMIAMTLTRVISLFFLVDTRYAIAERFYFSSLSRLVGKYDPDRKILKESFEELVKPRLIAKYAR